MTSRSPVTVRPAAPVETERGLVGLMLAEGLSTAGINPAWFADELASEVFAWAKAMREAGRPVTQEAAIAALGASKVGQIAACVAQGADSIIPELRDHLALRLIQDAAIDLGGAVAALAGNGLPKDQAIRSAIESAARALREAGASLDPGQRKTAKDCVHGVINALQDADRGIVPPSHTTGFPRIDRALGGGLRPGEMTVIGARPSVGKSALAGHIARLALNAGKRVLYCSRELKTEVLMARFLSAESGVNIRISDGSKFKTEAQRNAITAAAKRAAQWQLSIRDDLKTVGDVEREVEATSPDIVVVDHVGIFTSDLGPRASGYERLTDISNRLRDLALDADVAVLALAQINRTGADQDAPQLHHLKGSGSLEEDARVVMLMHRTGEDGAEKAIDLNIAKATSGECLLSQVTFNAPLFRFTERSPIGTEEAR